MTDPTRPFTIRGEMPRHTEMVHIHQHLVAVHPHVASAHGEHPITAVAIAENLTVQTEQLEVLDTLAAAFTAAASLHRAWQTQRDADEQRNILGALDRLAAWAPDTARRARVALTSGAPQDAVVAAEALTALVLPPAAANLEDDQAVVLAALRTAAEPVTA